MQSNNPITVDGKVYDRFAMNLAVSSEYKEGGAADASIALRLIPMRVSGGVVEKLEGQDVTIYLGTITGADLATGTAVAKVTAALQEFIDAKGL